MKGYKTVGTQKVSQKELNRSQKEYERFWNRQKEREMRQPVKTTSSKKLRMMSILGYELSIRKEDAQMIEIE